MAIKTSAISSAKNAVNRAKTAAEKKKEEEEKRQAQEARNRKSTDTKANSGKSGTKAISAVAKQAAETAVRRVEAETGQTATKEAKDAVTRAAKKAAKAATEQVKQASTTKTIEKKGLATDAAKSTFQKISERIAASEPGKQAAATEKGMQNILARYRFADDLAARTAQRQENILNNREGLTSTGAAKELLGPDKFLPRWSPYSPASMTYLPPAYLDRIAKDESLAAKGFGLGSDKVSYADILAATALDPLSALKADSKSNAFFSRGAGMKSKPWTEELTDTEKIKEGINRLAEQQKKERRVRASEQQSLSPYDQKLRAQFQQEIRNAKADYDSAKARGDAPGMVEAHRRAETWRRLEGGYSGGTAGDEYISPKLDNADISLLNKTGQTQLKAAKLGYENAQSDEERARYAAMGQDIRRNPAYLKPVHDRGAYRETDAEGRMRYAGTAEERQKEKEQLAAVPAAIGTGVAGSFLAIPGTTARALQTDAARNQAALQNLSDIRGGGEVNISEPERRKTAQEKLDAFLASERYQKASPTAKANLLMYALRDINKETPLNERLLNRANFYREKATEGQKGLERYLTEALITGGEMIPGLAATALSGGAAAPGLAVMGTQAAGRRMGELEAAGEDPVRAFNRGVVTGLIEAGTELIPLRNLTKIARGGGDSFARNLLTQAIEEAGTEVASDYLNYGADKAFRDPNAARPTLQDVKDTAIISALTSLGMGAGAGIIGARRTGVQRTEQTGTIQQAADNLRQAAADLEASQARTRAMREEMRGQQPETAGAESFARREQDIQVRTELWNRRINRTLDRLANAGEDQTYRAHLERELAQQQQEGRDLLAERDRLRQERTRTEEAQQIAEESRYRADRARETGAELAADVTARINARAQEARDRLDREEIPVFTAMRDALRGAAAERTEAARQTEPGFSPLQPPRERTAEAPPVTEKETERKHSPGYNTAENHIDNRQTGDVYLGDRNVKAFQWDHPEVKPFFKKAAAALKQDAEYADSTKHSQRASNIQRARGKKAGTVMEKNDVIRKLMDRGLSTTDIIKACDAIINDEGQENYAAAKRVELALDDMLSKGYTPTDSGYKAEDKVAARVAPDAEYLAVKDRIAGAVKQGSWERYLRDNEAMLDWGEVTEDELRAEWEALQAQPQEATEAARPTDPEPRTFASFEEEMADLGSRVNSLIEEWQEARRTRPEDQEAEAYYREQAQQVPVIEQAIREKWGRAETPEPEPTPYARREEPPVREEEQERYSVGAAPGGFDPYSRMLNEYGAIEPGENPARMVDVPRSTDGEDRVSKAARTFMEAQLTSDPTQRKMEKDLIRGMYSHRIKGMEETMDRAYEYLDANGLEDAESRWDNVVNGRIKATEDELALGMALWANAERTGNSDRAAELAAQIAAEGTTAGRMINIYRMLKRATPEGRVYYAQTIYEKLSKEMKQKYGKKAPKIEANEDLLDDYKNAETEKERFEALDRIYEDIAKQMPRNVGDILNAWRYLAMLGNPRTHIRNVVGNVLFGELERASGKVSAAMQKALPQEQRTRALTSTRAAREFAAQDADEMENMLRGDKYDTDLQAIQRKQQERALGPLSFLAKGNSRLLSWEDFRAKRRVYKRSIASFITAKGWDPNNLTMTQLEQARSHAYHDAQVATFQEENAVANKIAKLEQTNTATKIAIGGLVPFKSVPLNIAKQGFAYSPFGALTSGIELHRALEDMKNEVTSGKKTAAEAIDGLAKGLTGASIAVIGILLAAKGLLSSGGTDDDDLDALEMAQGSQEYALKIGDHTYTLDWAAPSALPLFLGAEVYNLFASPAKKMQETEEAEDEDYDETAVEQGANWFDTILSSAIRFYEPMFNMTVLSGLTGAISAAAYGKTKADKSQAVLVNAIQNYAGQFNPTVLGQINRTFFDDTRRTTFVDKNKDVDASWQRFIQRQTNKIPGKSKSNMPYLDVWGRESKQENGLLRALENFVSPGYLKKVEKSDVAEELARLNAEGFEKILPKNPAKYGKIDGKFMTQDQYEARAKAQGKTSLDMLMDAMKSDEYNSMSDEEKAAYVKKIFGYAQEKGKEAAGAEKVATWVSTMDQAAKDNDVGVSALMRACMHIDNTGDADGNGSVKTEEAWNAIQDMDGPEALKRAAFAVYNGTDNTYDEYKADAEEKARKQAEVDKYFSALPEDAQTKILEACDGNLKNFTQEQAYVTIKGLGLSAAQEKAAYNGINVEAGWVKDGQPRTWESFESTVSKKIQKNGLSEPKEKKETDLSQYFDESELERAEEVNDYIESHGGYFTSMTQWGENMSAMGVPKSEWPTYFNYANIRRGNRAWGSPYEKAAKDHNW